MKNIMPLITLIFLVLNACLFSMEKPTIDWETLPLQEKDRIYHFFDAIEQNNIQSVEENIDLVIENYTPYWNPLGYASFYSRTEIVKMLLAANFPVDKPVEGFRNQNFTRSCGSKHTALHWALSYTTHKEIIELLLKAGADHTSPISPNSFITAYSLFRSSFFEKSNNIKNHEFFFNMCQKYNIKPDKNEVYETLQHYDQL